MLEHEWDQRSVQFPLTEESVVLDIGAYKGRWSKEIAARYGCRIYAFEPQVWAASIALDALAEFENTSVSPFGLGVESGVFEMEEFETDGATFMLGRSQRQQNGEGRLMEMLGWLSTVDLDHNIDLIMMNIEGYEFKLIPYMIEKGIMQKVNYFMCQFHPHGYEQADEYEAIRKQMAEIMDIHFDYGIVLVCWKSKEYAKKAIIQREVYPTDKDSVAPVTGESVEGVVKHQPVEKPKRKSGRKKAG